MFELWYNQPVRTHLLKSGTYQECKQYLNDNKDKLLKKWGDILLIRNNKGITVYREGSQMKGVI